MENKQFNKSRVVKSRPHPILAGFIDFYMVNLVIGSVVSIFNTITGINIYYEMNITGAVILTVLILGGVITYYLFYSKKVMFLSFGEFLTGRRIERNIKVWTNPFNCNRLGIFVVIIINMIMFANEWDSISRGYIYTFTGLIGKLIRIAIKAYALKEFSNRNLNGLIILIIISLLSIIGFQSQGVFPDEMKKFGTYFSLVIAAFYTVIYIIYTLIFKKQQIQ
ncbi:hypothetical protein [Anaeromicrobium sediminis]|uniref:Uncharacterized protein n=1 Tax=Anaeromicrobium sediminis TaxID=1478221 RepID=A0A267MPP5_9FIRM|nr:hypothetical protein [Anaeromicrobium sediminis]PAB61402.1 hypothetical protein CCE28_02955 [Anaeromicrobium sediminis]